MPRYWGSRFQIVLLKLMCIHGNKYAQVFSHKNGFGLCYPINRLTGDSIGQQLQHFCFDWGIPEFLKSDGHPSQAGPHTLFQKLVRLHQMHHTLSEPYRLNQNPAEGTIREIKKNGGTGSCTRNEYQKGFGTMA